MCSVNVYLSYLSLFKVSLCILCRECLGDPAVLATVNMVSFFDIDSFIIEIEDRPALWDVRLTEYNNKIVKAKAWEELCAIFVPNFNKMDSSGKSRASNTL